MQWHKIKLTGLCSGATDVLPKSSSDTAQAVGNLILVLTKALSSSRACT